MMQYVSLYGFVRRKDGLRIRPRGVDHGQCFLYHTGGESAAVITPVELKSFTADVANMVKHDEAVLEIHRRQVIVPVKFPQLVTLKALGNNLVNLDAQFSRILAKVVFKSEYRVKVLLTDLTIAKAPSLYYNVVSRFFMENSSSYKYKHFFPILTEEAREAEFVSSTEQIVQEISRKLCRHSVYWKARSFQRERVLLDAYFWVRKHVGGPFLEETASLKRFFPNISFNVLGPYPPYNFVKIDLKSKQNAA